MLTMYHMQVTVIYTKIPTDNKLYTLKLRNLIIIFKMLFYEHRFEYIESDENSHAFIHFQGTYSYLHNMLFFSSLFRYQQRIILHKLAVFKT